MPKKKIEPFKVKTSVKPKKEFRYYIVRRVNNFWEMSSPRHKVYGGDLNELAEILDELELNPEVVHPPKPRKKTKSKK